MKVFNSTKAYEIVNPECPSCDNAIAKHVSYNTEDCLTAEQAALDAAGHMARIVAWAAVKAMQEGAEAYFFNRAGPEVSKKDNGLYVGRWRGSVVVTRYPFTPKLSPLGILTSDEEKSEVADAA